MMRTVLASQARHSISYSRNTIHLIIHHLRLQRYSISSRITKPSVRPSQSVPANFGIKVIQEDGDHGISFIKCIISPDTQILITPIMNNLFLFFISFVVDSGAMESSECWDEDH